GIERLHSSRQFNIPFAIKAEMEDIGNADLIWIPVQYADFRARTDNAWLYNREIKSAFPADQESLDHVIHPESKRQLVPGHSGLSHHQRCRSNPKFIADMKRFLGQSLRRQVFAEVAVGKIHARQLFLPI